MPKKPNRPCSYPGCPRLTEGLFCEEHQKQEHRTYNRYRRDPDTAKRYGASWRRIRSLYVSARPLCEECLKHGRYVPVEEVHHIVPLSNGGTNDPENLMSLCKSCHSAITIGATNRHS